MSTQQLSQPNQQPIGPQRPISVAVTRPTGKRTSVVKWLVLGFLVATMVVMGFLTIVMIGALNTGLVGLIGGMVMAIVPVPIYLTFVVWLDRFEREPWRMLGLTFLWGATGAIFFAFIVNTVLGAIVAELGGPEAGNLFMVEISAPIFEELLKAVALFGIFLFRRREFNGIVDGIVYAGMVGLGFAMTENFSYYGQFGPSLFLLRGTFLSFAHPLFTSMTGIGLGIASSSKNIFVQLVAPLVGLFFAISLHCFNNSLGSVLPAVFGDSGEVAGILTLIVAIPFFCLCVLLLAGFGLYRESKKIKQFLQVDVQAGRLTLVEAIRIGSITKRIWTTIIAFWKGGFRGWFALSRFHQIATELAFFRCNLSRGIYLHDANAISQEQEYLTALAELKPQLPQV